jgi:hypothetical protein
LYDIFAGGNMAPKTTYQGAPTMQIQLKEIRDRLLQIENFLYPTDHPLAPAASPSGRMCLVDKYVALFKTAHQKGIADLGTHVVQMEELMKGVKKEAIANMHACATRVEQRSTQVLEALDTRRAMFDGDFVRAQEYLKELPGMDRKVRDAGDALEMLASELEDVPAKLQMFDRKIQAISKRLDESSKLVPVTAVKTRRHDSRDRPSSSRQARQEDTTWQALRNMALHTSMKEVTEANESGDMTVEELRNNAAQGAALLLRGDPFDPRRRSTSAPPGGFRPVDQAADFVLLGPYVQNILVPNYIG